MTFLFRFFNEKIYGQISGYLKKEEFRNLKNGFTPTAGRKKEYINGNIKFNFQYEITNRLSIDCMGTIYPHTELSQTERGHMRQMDIGATYALLANKRLILVLDVQNVFDSNDNSTHIYYDQNYTNMFTHSKGPVFNFGVRLKFNRGKDITNQYKDNTPDMRRLNR
ncbi:MAG: outer membrane beta-barrel family protein [Prevotellaceae bacterium]|jgi:hypothetical protein|nr:outer membrane beta-barrel family protein [Prevotellaceae bacterium]